MKKGASRKEDASRFDHRNLDDVIHSRIRLAIMSILISFEETEFTFLREQVGTTDGNLITHVNKLIESGYVSGEKRSTAGRPATVYSLTREGRKAFEDYLAQLEKLLPR